ncbi:hypothetical protein [Streptomyces sp. SCL15-4]|uniref:hypothetical protein n=1 Tax=Streptomyces sp. SCL15-4 TaxID=2967221 RepID=UPI00296671D0|nr:hypothetical protein [Streptomyces sp. SCL15-4]
MYRTAGLGRTMADMLDGVQEIVGEVLGGYETRHGTACREWPGERHCRRDDARWETDDFDWNDSWCDHRDDCRCGRWECRCCERREHRPHRRCRCDQHHPPCHDQRNGPYRHADQWWPPGDRCGDECCCEGHGERCCRPAPCPGEDDHDGHGHHRPGRKHTRRAGSRKESERNR